MPRAGSVAAPPEPMSIGSVANPPFAVTPDPAATFRRRAARLGALADGAGPLGPWLDFLARLCAAQADALDGLPEPRLPDAASLARAAAHGMPPLGRESVADDPAALAAFDALLARLDAQALTDEARAAVDALRAADPADRAALLDEALADEASETAVAARVLAGAALQIHMTRLAAMLAADTLTRVTDAACPACGATVAASTVVTWDDAANTRFCACSLCATQWHVVRVRCLSCGDEGRITFRGLEELGEAVQAESCGACGAYVKIVYQARDAAVEPVADDAASLALDLALREKGERRFGRNLFLAGV